MAGGFGTLEIARSGLSVSERGLFVTGHNLSNVNTPGYARQQAISVTSSYLNELGKYETGMGAQIQQVRQIRHTFLDDIYRKENTTLGYWEARSKTVQDVESILGDPMGSGLQEVLNQFWDSWQELSKSPDSQTQRALVRQRGESLVYQINHTGAQLDKLQNDLNSEIQVRIGEINDITRNIASLNSAISREEAGKNNANDYRDQRNVLLDKLSKLVNIDVTETQTNQVDISLGGYFLVSQEKNFNLYAAEETPGSRYFIPKLEGLNVEVPLKSGSLKGLLESRGEVNGGIGSVENGSPNNKAQVTVLVDAAIVPPIDTTPYEDDLKKRGFDVTVTPVSISNFTNLAAALSAVTSQYALVFTSQDASTATAAEVNDLTVAMDALKNANIKTSVITGTNPSAWNTIGGKIYDIGASNFASIMTTISSDTSADMNRNMSIVEKTLNILPDVKKQLNALFNTIVREVNYMQRLGKTASNPPIDGQDFFVAIRSTLPLEMGNIKVNPNLSDLNNIVASKTGDKGDNSMALAIANIRNSRIIEDVTGILNCDAYYQSIISDVGNTGAEARQIESNQTLLVNSSDNARQGIMGVSMDEEMGNMMKYKYSYNASTKVLSAIDQMIETVIEKMGMVGR